MNKKQKAGRLLSKFLRQIAEEKTECLKIDGEDTMVTKAEALARLMWKMALGSKENEVKDGKLIEVVRHPDKSMISLVYDRIEGKAPMMEDSKPSRSVADKVDEQGRHRIAQAGKLDTEGSTDQVA